MWLCLSIHVHKLLIHSLSSNFIIFIIFEFCIELTDIFAHLCSLFIAPFSTCCKSVFVFDSPVCNIDNLCMFVSSHRCGNSNPPPDLCPYSSMSGVFFPILNFVFNSPFIFICACCNCCSVRFACFVLYNILGRHFTL